MGAQPCFEPSLDGFQLLVVDDDPTSCLVIAKMLERFGARVETASSGGHALELFAAGRHPIVVTDICMPGMDGIELVANLKQIDQRVMAIAATAVSDKERLISALRLGFSDYILKPVGVDQLIWAVKRCGDILEARRQLEDEQNKFRTVLECLGEGVSIKDLNLGVVYQNSALTGLLGDRTGRTCYTAHDGRSEPCPDCQALLAMRHGGTHSSRQLLQRQGREFSVESTASPLVNSRGEIVGAVEITRDISEQVRSAHILSNIAKGISAKIGADFFHSLVSYLTETLGVSYALVGELNASRDRVKTLAYCSRGGTLDALEYQLAGTPCAAVVSDGPQVYSDHVAELFAEDHPLSALGIRNYCGAPLIDSRGTVFGVLCTFDPAPITNTAEVSDIIRIFASRASAEMERLKAEEIIREQALHDPLTGLANRRLYQERLALAVASSQRSGARFGLLFLDLDHFKQINDRLGHDAGDQVLVEAASRLSECFKRRSDTICRQGGDEFAVILTEVNGRKDLLGQAERLVKEFARPVWINGIEVRVTASMGLSMYPEDADEAKDLEMASDRGMYLAKRSGRNSCRFAGDPP